MRALAMQIWEMPAMEFAGYLISAVVIISVWRYIQAEIALGRVKRATRMGLR